MNLVRALINDSQAGATATPGEGQVFTDNPAISPFTQPFLNSSIRELYRELRNVGQPALIKDNIIITGLTPVNSPTYGLAAADPAVQVYLGVNGYFDGVTINPDLLLPGDMVAPERVWERETNSNNPFLPMTQPQFGLSSRFQTPALGQWEWRNEAIWMCGSTQTRDLRLRYYCALPQYFSSTLDFAATCIPIIDCADAVAYKTAVKYATMLGSPGLADLKTDAAEQMRQLKLTHVRRQQSIDFNRIVYGRATTDGMQGVTIGWQ
jgi:hypothetical protein